jgi:hypothetical protein
VRNNRLYLPHGQYYEVLVLPPGRSVNPDVLKKIEQLVKDGATIIGPKPDKGVSLNHLTTVNNQIQQLTNSVWGSCDSIQIKENSYGKGKIVWGKPLRDVLIEKGIEPDVTSNQSDRLDFIHRKTENEEIYFIRNISNAQFSDRVSFRVNDLVPQLWNAESGEIIPIPVFSTEGGRISIPLSFDSEESKLIVFRKGNSKPTTSLSAEGIANPVFYFTKAGTVTSTSGNWRWKVNQEQEKTKTVSLPSPVELKGPWYLRFDQTKGAPPRDTLQTLIPLNESRKTGVKYYSGVVTYQTSFSIVPEQLAKNRRVILNLGSVKEIAEVFINGNNMGTVWHSPFEVDITDGILEGKNTLIIEIVNTINNRLVGDAKLPVQYRRTSGNITKLPNAWMTPFAEAPLLKSGLIGPVHLSMREVLIDP